MVDRDPILFREWSAYMKHRQIMVSSIVLKSSGWTDWNASHAKLLGVFLWNYETKKVNGFRYRDVLRKHAYRRTHNYRLLSDLIQKAVLANEGRGFYRLRNERLRAAEKAIVFIRGADDICSEEAKNCPIQWNNIL